MKKTPHQLHNHRQKLLMVFPPQERPKVYMAIREMQARIGRKLKHHEFEKFISTIKYQ